MYKRIIVGFFRALLLFGVVAPALVLAQGTSTDPVVPASTTTPASATQIDFRARAQVEARVRAYFADAPIMAEIAKCESKFRQLADSGNVLRGGSDSGMIGVFQINEQVHRAYAASIGLDIDTLEGNIGYARYLHMREGTNPWISSFPCWNAGGGTTLPAPADTSGQSGTFPTKDLSFGMIDPQVLLLQQSLNRAGFRVAESGPGAPGSETTKFGSLTRVALRNFQCAKQIACGGDEYATGYGFLNKQTRDALSAAPEAKESAAELEAKITELTKTLEELKAKLALANSPSR